MLTCQQEEHEHSLQCFSDPGADTDPTAWDSAAEKAIETLSEEDRADWRRRTVAIARSQEGCGESQRNYQVDSDGQTMRGYTIYGAAYGAPYADWVLQKAAVPGFPLASGADEWMKTLGSSDETQGTAYLSGTEPRVGDLVFIRTEDAPGDTEYADRVGTYTVTGDGDNWHKEISDLPRADASGNEYTYYVVETSPASGYETTYLGQNDGLTDEETATIRNKLSEVSIEIIKKNAETKASIPGATFTLTPVDESGIPIPGGAQKSGTTGESGKITIEKLAPGRYKLEETGIPAGYVVSEGPYFIQVTVDGSDSVEGTQTLISADGHTFTVENTPGAALPSTGGPGTGLLFGMGAMLLLGALLLLRWRRIAIS